MSNLIKSEVYKIFRQKKLYVFMGIMLFSMIFDYIFYLLSRNITADNANPFLNMNGQLFPIHTLNGANTVIVIFIIILLADMVTDEYKSGTLKLSLLGPVTRAKLLAAKVAGLYIGIVALLFFTITASYIVGIIGWGWGDTLVINGFSGQTSFSRSFSPLNGIIFTAGSYLFSTIPFLAFGIIVFFISLLYTNMGATIGTGLGIYFVLGLVVQFIAKSKPFMINTYFDFYMEFAKGISINSLIPGILVILAYGIVFFSCSLIIFKRKDILL